MEPEVMDDDSDDTRDDDRPTALELRRPDVPATLNDLAARKGEAIEIIEARALVLKTLRLAAIRATSPEDWLLFKAPDEQGGQIVAYLQDCGADRVRDLYGIEIFDISKPEKVQGQDAGVFHYLISGSGRCKLTRQILENVEGGRSSTDDFCRGKTGVELELAVRKAARANLDGNITRELAGLKSVPFEELVEGWKGTTKNPERCRKGRGFGTASERLGARKETAPDVDPPTCPHCPPVNGAPVKLKYREAKGNRAAFFGCPNFEKHPQQRVIVDAAGWIEQQKKSGAAATETSPAAAPAKKTDSAPPQKATGRPPSQEEIFGRSTREPGEDG